jgi:N4-gp56 family major capsid protein
MYFNPSRGFLCGPRFVGGIADVFRFATTDFVRATTHANLVEKVWSAKLFKFMHKNSYFGKYVGKEGSGSIVETKTELLKESGDQITFAIDRPITDSGTIDDGDREGQEVAMVYDDYSVTIHQWAQQVRMKGKKTEQSTSIRLRNRAKVALGNWGKFMIDYNTTLALSGLASNNGTFAASAHSTNRKWYGGQTAAGTVESVAADANIDSATNNLFGPNVIEAIKRKATLAASGYSKLQPVIVDGEELFVIFIHKYQAKALKASTDWKNGHLYSDVRGRKNAIFSGSPGIWDGVLIHEYDHIETRLGAGGSTSTEYFESGDDCANGIYVARALFCGRVGAVHAYAQYPSMAVKKFEYGSQFGCSIDMLIGVGKPQFNSEDYGVITVDTAYVPD